MQVLLVTHAEISIALMRKTKDYHRFSLLKCYFRHIYHIKTIFGTIDIMFDIIARYHVTKFYCASFQIYKYLHLLLIASQGKNLEKIATHIQLKLKFQVSPGIYKFKWPMVIKCYFCVKSI